MTDQLPPDLFSRIYNTKQKLEEAIKVQTKIVEGNVKRLETFKHLYKRYEND